MKIIKMFMNLAYLLFRLLVINTLLACGKYVNIISNLFTGKKILFALILITLIVLVALFIDNTVLVSADITENKVFLPLLLK